MKNKDWALVISLGVLWGMSFVFDELLLAYLSPFMIVYLRVAIGYQSVFQIYDGTIGKYLILLATVSYAFAGIWGNGGWRACRQ